MEFPSYWANYIEMLSTVDRDRQQTLSLEENGFYEQNPLLGKHPSKSKINAYFGFRAAALSPFYLDLMEAPPWVKSSVADSAGLMAEMTVRQNEALFSGEAKPRGLPIGAVFTYHGDWDKFLEDKFRLFTGEK